MIQSQFIGLCSQLLSVPNLFIIIYPGILVLSMFSTMVTPRSGRSGAMSLKHPSSFLASMLDLISCCVHKLYNKYVHPSKAVGGLV